MSNTGMGRVRTYAGTRVWTRVCVSCLTSCFPLAVTSCVERAKELIASDWRVKACVLFQCVDVLSSCAVALSCWCRGERAVGVWERRVGAQDRLRDTALTHARFALTQPVRRARGRTCTAEAG